MESNEKQALVEGTVESAVFRVPASLAEAYELGWQWQRESFAGLREFETTKEGVVRREGLALFVSERKTDSIVIPFVATYDFGTPRLPKYPYKSGPVFSVDEDPEPEIIEPKTPREIKEERQAIWTVKHRFRGNVIFTYTTPEPKTHNIAIESAGDAFCDDLLIEVSEVKAKKAKASRSTKKQKSRR
jgi:hypothetical protein